MLSCSIQYQNYVPKFKNKSLQLSSRMNGKLTFPGTNAVGLFRFFVRCNKLFTSKQYYNLIKLSKIYQHSCRTNKYLMDANCNAYQSSIQALHRAESSPHRGDPHLHSGTALRPRNESCTVHTK